MTINTFEEVHFGPFQELNFGFRLEQKSEPCHDLEVKLDRGPRKLLTIAYAIVMHVC